MAQAGHYEDGVWIPGDDEQSPRTGTKDDPVYGNTGTNLDPWGQKPGDRDYGYPPGTNPVWDQTNPVPKKDPPPKDDTGVVGGGGGGGASTTAFDYPDWVAPTEDWKTFTEPTPTVTPFSYKDFEGPTADTFQADPGYDFRMNQMKQAVLNEKSAKGLLSTGSTLTDLMGYAGGLASQEFGNVWNRQKTSYDTNRNNAFTAWQGNAQLDNDHFTHDLTSYLTQEQAKADDWTRSLTAYTTNLNKYMGIGGLNVNQQNSQFSNLLSLYGLMTKNMPTYSPTAA